MDVVSRIQLAANKGQIGDLTKMGTGKFEANTFLNHLHQSVEGDCVFTEKRAKVLPMEASILLDVRFGPNGANGHKELNLKFKLEGGWKVSAYKFWDINVPGKPPAEPLPEGKMRDLL